MKITDQREMQKNKNNNNNNNKKQRQRGIKGTEAVMVKDK